MDIFHQRKHLQQTLEEAPGATGSVFVLRHHKHSEEFMRAVDRAHGLRAFPELDWMRTLQSSTVARLFGDSEGLKTFARMYLAEGAYYLSQGEELYAATKYFRALELFLEVLHLHGAGDNESLEAVFALSTRLDPAGLADEYQERLRRVTAH